VEHTSKCGSIFKSGWNIQLVLMFLSVILQLGMCKQPFDFVITTWRGAYIRERIFRGGSTVKWMRCAMNPSWIHLYMQPAVLYHCDEVDHLFASLFAIWLTKVDRTISAFHLPLSYISRGYNPSLIQFFLGKLVSRAH